MTNLFPRKHVAGMRTTEFHYLAGEANGLEVIDYNGGLLITCRTSLC